MDNISILVVTVLRDKRDKQAKLFQLTHGFTRWYHQAAFFQDEPTGRPPSLCSHIKRYANELDFAKHHADHCLL